jgi:hypothetical protein
MRAQLGPYARRLSGIRSIVLTARQPEVSIACTDVTLGRWVVGLSVWGTVVLGGCDSTCAPCQRAVVLIIITDISQRTQV